MDEIVALPADNVRSAIDDPDRPVADRERDGIERIEAVLRASGIARGMKVADLRAGDGYLAQLLVKAVYRLGRVWANNDPASLDARAADAWRARLADPATGDLARLDLPLGAPLPAYAADLNIVFSRGAYHDAVARGIDRASMNAAVFAALTPGGRYVIVDARAEDGAARDAAALCRVPESLVRKEVEAAGFRLVSSSDALRATKPPATGSACQQAASADRFLLVYERPRD